MVNFSLDTGLFLNIGMIIWYIYFYENWKQNSDNKNILWLQLIFCFNGTNQILKLWANFVCKIWVLVGHRSDWLISI
jgi:hypothetical protein